MEVWKYIEILTQKKQGWLFRKDNLEDRLRALDQIREIGTLSTIIYLIPFLKDVNKDIQNRTCDVIAHLFESKVSKKNYYNALRYCDISKSDMDYYQQTFSAEECLVLYSIASLNGRGYIREKAVRYLIDSNNEKALPFIIYRLADWVSQIREVALRGMEHYKKTEFVNELVSNLPIFDWIRQVQRVDLNAVYADIIHFVVIDHADYLSKHFATYNENVRIAIAKRIVDVLNIEQEKLRMLLNDKSFIVRSTALEHFDRLTQSQIGYLLTDRSAQIRLKILRLLKDRPNFAAIVYPFLMDQSRSIRELARYSLKDSISDFAGIYNDRLLNNESVISSLYGLAETDGKGFVSSAIPFLNSPTIKVRKAAFLAIRHLDESLAYDFALQNMDSPYGGIRKTALAYLSGHASAEVLEKARVMYKNGDYDLKKAMLSLFNKIGKWQVIADIMIGTVDDNANIRNISLVYLRQWLNKAPSYFITPQQEDLERANSVFDFAFKVHEEKRYFNNNPLSGIEFYLR